MRRSIYVPTVVTVVSLILLAFVSSAPVAADPHPGQSVNVAYIDSLTVVNGGTFPTTTSGTGGSFTDYHFFRLPVANVGTAALGPGGVCGAAGCDTVLLNVASSGMTCNVNRLTTQQKAELVSFVAGGYKLIIYDSECSPQDYSWLPFPFTTANPGAQGAQGTLTIVEENTLSSNDPANVHYINALLLSTQTDAVGDMNVMTTIDPNWFVDMSGTNILNRTGPVHTYAKYPSGGDQGLIIYNGFDVDYMSSGTIPNASNPAGNLAKIWLHELQQPYNPSGLPGGNPVVGIVLEPAQATVGVGQNHTLNARLTDLLGVPQPGITVTFSVVSGPNTGVSGTCNPNVDCTSDANGEVYFTYAGIGGTGDDQIRACFTNLSGQPICSQEVTASWTGKIPVIILPGVAASWNADVILGGSSGPGDPKDWGFFTLAKADEDWEPFIEALRNASYKEDIDYVVCHYDWRKTLDWTDLSDGTPDSSVAVKDYLVPCINRVKGNSGASKVHLVGHSLGGLLARSYVESPIYRLRNDVAKVVTLGTPHKGVAGDYYVWEGAEVPPHWSAPQRIGLNFFLRANCTLRDFGGNLERCKLASARTYLPSARDILPVDRDYLVDLPNFPAHFPWNQMHEINLFMRDVMPPDSASEVFDQMGVTLDTIGGLGYSTTYEIGVRPSLQLPVWEDGRPERTFSEDGDQTVAQSDTRLLDIDHIDLGTPQEPVKHREIPGKAVTTAFGILGIPNVSPELAPLMDHYPIFLLLLLSPATISIQDPGGNQVGDYSDEAGIKVAILRDTVPGIYTVTVTGTGTGTYELSITYMDEEITRYEELSGYVEPGSQDVYLLNYDPELPDDPMDVSRVVNIDIKPGSDPNSVLCKNPREIITVAALTNGFFNATTIDHSTVAFEGARETHINQHTGQPQRHEEDVDSDGDMDLVFHFRLGDTSLTCGSTYGTLVGETFDGRGITGTDSVNMVTRNGNGP